MQEQYTPYSGEIAIQHVTKNFGHVRSLDDVTATGIYAAAQAVAELIGEGEE